MICTTCKAPSLDGPQGTTAAVMKLPQESVFRLLRDDKRLVSYADGSRGWTPLQYAAYYAFDSVLDVIVQAQIDVVNQFSTWKFWRRSVKGKSTTQKNLVCHGKWSADDAESKMAKKKLMNGKLKRIKKELVLYKKRTSTQIIVTTLITTVSFTIGFTMPGGYYQSGEPDQGLVLLSRETAFNAFMVADGCITSGTYVVLSHSPALAITFSII